MTYMPSASYNLESRVLASPAQISTLEATVMPEYAPIGHQESYVPQIGIKPYVSQGSGYQENKKTYASIEQKQVTYQSAQEEKLTQNKTEYFSPKIFLKANRPKTKFTTGFDEVEGYVKKIFKKITGHDIPKDIIINIVPKKELKKIHGNLGGTFTDGIQGFCINRKPFDFTTIFVKENNLDELLLTLGHEIGHAMSLSLKNKILEEAKAFAFEMEWIKVIYEEDIANLKNSLALNPNPANNGLHDRAFNFVLGLINQGKEAINIFNEIVSGELCLDQ